MEKHSNLISQQRNTMQVFLEGEIALFSFNIVLICNFLQRVSKLPCKVESEQFFLKISLYYLYFPRLRQISFLVLKFYVFNFERQHTLSMLLDVMCKDGTG